VAGGLFTFWGIILLAIGAFFFIIFLVVVAALVPEKVFDKGDWWIVVAALILGPILGYREVQKRKKSKNGK